MKLLFPQTRSHSKLNVFFFFLFFFTYTRKIAWVTLKHQQNELAEEHLSQKHWNLYIAPIICHCIPKAAENLIKIKGNVHYTALFFTGQATIHYRNAQHFQGDSYMQKARRSLKDAFKKKAQQTKSEETIGVPIYYGMNMTHRSSHQTDLYFPKLSHRARLHRLLLNELPLSGWEHKDLAFQTKLFQLTVL